MSTCKVFVINKFKIRNNDIFRLGFLNNPDHLMELNLTYNNIKWKIVGIVTNVEVKSGKTDEFYENYCNKIYDCILKPINTFLLPEIGDVLEFEVY